MPLDDLILVCGARRTGTTLAAAILSADEAAPPLPGEAQLLPRWLESYRWAREQFDVRALPFFADPPAFRAFYRRLLDVFLRHCREHFRDSRVLVLKSPELSLFFPEAHDLLPEARFVVTTRDPRDQVASEWQVLERRRGDWDAKILRDRDFSTLAASFVHYYRPVVEVIERDPARIHLLRYEDLVQRPERALERLGAFTGLDLRAFDPKRAWPRVAATYWAYGTSPSDTPLYGGAIDASRVGSHAEVMSREEARLVGDACAEVAERLGYPRDEDEAPEAGPAQGGNG